MRDISRNIFFFFLLLLFPLFTAFSCNETYKPEPITDSDIVNNWKKISGPYRNAKVVYAVPPDLMVLYLNTGLKKRIPGILVAGGTGRINRGFSPRPFWSPDGKRFIYRYNNQVFIGDEDGNKLILKNPQMDAGKETRWSWFEYQNTLWAVGPAKNRNLILVNIKNPEITRIAYGGKNVKWHAEITGKDHRVVFFNGRSVFVTKLFSRYPGIKISSSQSCRPCAAPDNRAAWLPSPHTRYSIHDSRTGEKLMDLKAPENEEMYRLNWSNVPDYAVHMFGSRGNNRMHVRRISTGESAFIGNGWDPDLWIKR